jgi:hypothetical protein
MEIALAAFVLDVLKEIRDSITKAKGQRQDLIAKGTFLELYGSATRLLGQAEQIGALRGKSSSKLLLPGALREFFMEVRKFGAILSRANAYAIEVYHPGLADALTAVRGRDIEMISTFEKIGAQFGLNESELQRVRTLYLNFDALGPNSATFEEARWEYRSFHSFAEPDVLEAFDQLSECLGPFCQVLADVIRQSWDFKELATLRAQT